MNAYAEREKRDSKKQRGIIDSWHLVEIRYRIRADNYRKLYAKRVEFYNNIPYTSNELRYFCLGGPEVDGTYLPSVEDVDDVQIESAAVIQDRYF